VILLYFTLGYSAHDRRFLTALHESLSEIHYLPLTNRSVERAAIELPAGIFIEPALDGGRDPSLISYPSLARRLKKKLQAINPAIVHAGPIHLAAAVAALSGFHPLVSMSWGSDLLWETRSPLVTLAARWTLARTDAFVGDCQAVRRAALQRFTPGDASPVRDKLGWQGCFVLLSARPFEPFYGVEQIVESFCQAAANQPELRLLLLGEGSRRPNIEQRLAQAGLLDRAHFSGFVDLESLPDYYRSADLYVSGTRSDGSSVSLLEAMGCGLPVLVSNIPGNREWVESGVNGWFFEAGSSRSLREELERILSVRGSLNTVGMAGRRIVENRANWRENFPKLLQAYEIALRHAGKVVA
jgi:glycosyltransferase involved in cell wall biosynthesis